MANYRWALCGMVLLVGSGASHGTCAGAAERPKLDIHPHDSIAIVGNTLADRMQHFGHFETLLHHRFPRHELVVRDLGFSGDELTVRLRSAGFGSPEDHLRAVKADVVLAFFGYNESFAGVEGLEKFKRELASFVDHTLGEKYNGKTPPRLVLFSPIAHEDLHDSDFADGKDNNTRIALYTAAMEEVAGASKVLFVDLYAPSLESYRKADKPLTINGVHLNERGDQQLAAILDRGLFGGEGDAPREWTALEPLRQAVLDKNFHWFQRATARPTAIRAMAAGRI